MNPGPTDPTVDRDHDKPPIADETTEHRPRGTNVDETVHYEAGGSGPRPVRIDTGALPHLEGAGRYTLHGELARGGMGAVLRGRDTELGRELAIKVLLERHRQRPEVLRRFIEEAQIGGQLQHPGIVPVYDLGRFADDLPFFVMKLVSGRDLAVLLRDRASPTAELPRFLGIFEQIAQTVAYAHAMGVIHRDLKPSNVMVGDFGEVQLMDWGLAKVLRGQEGAPADSPATAVSTNREEDGPEASRHGDVMGTPAYMAPEQARGDVTRVDKRSDVFGLGAVLCEVLTGHPPFVGASTVQVLNNAARADTEDAFARLEACGADHELITLAKDCLAGEPEARPKDAGVVASRTSAYLTGVQERLRTAERERAVAEARAVEERRRRKLQLGLAASLVTLLVAGGLVTLTVLRQRAARSAAVAEALAEARTLRDQAIEHADDLARWQAAREAVRRVELALGPDGEMAATSDLKELARGVEAGAEAARQDQELLAKTLDVRSAKVDDYDGLATDAAYRHAFREAGLDLDAGTPAEVGEKIKQRPTAVSIALAAAIDDWANLLRDRDPARAARLWEVASIADPDPWRVALRAALRQADPTKRLDSLKKLAETAQFDQLGPISLDLLGSALAARGAVEEAEKVFREAQRRHPADVWVNHDLATLLERQARRDEAIRYYTAARAIRAETAHELAHALEKKGEPDEALAVFRDLSAVRPGSGRHLGCLGLLLLELGRREEGLKALDAAVAAHRDTLRTQPNNAQALALIGLALFKQGKLEEAEAAYRESIRIRPDAATAHDSLGRVLEEQERLDDAIAAYREAIRLDPKSAASHQNLTVPLARTGRLDEAERTCRRALELDPNDARSHINLGNIMKIRGRMGEAAAAFREAVRIWPRHANAHYALGQALALQNDLEGALAEVRIALELSPPESDLREQLPGFIKQLENQTALSQRLPGVLKGDDEPISPAEAVTFADLCSGRGLHAAAARLFDRAIKWAPGIVGDRPSPVRYNAACAAALAASGLGRDDPPPDEAAKTTLRKQALDWLRAELSAWAKLRESGPPPARKALVQTLRHWTKDDDLAGVREELALGKLTEDEAGAWKALWREVAGQLAQGEQGP